MKKYVWKSESVDNPLKPNDIKKYIPDIYVPCYCGSGKKFKFCCYMKKDIEMHNPSQVHQYMIKNRKKHSYCIYADNNCTDTIIKSHSIQNNKILSKLAVDNHVYVFDFNASVFGGTDIMKCGRNQATTSTCFCSYHDSKIFSDIEKKNYEYTQKQNFLYAYRAFSKYYYDRIVGLEDTRNIFSAMPNRAVAMGFVDRIKGLEISVTENEEIKEEFNDALKNKKYSVVKTITLTLDYEVGFATSYMSPLSYDLEGNMISDVHSMEGRMRNIFVNIFPENGKSYILISWLISDDGPWFEKFSNQFDIYKNNRELLMRILNNMVTCQSDNIVFSKNLLDTWDEKSKEFFLNEYISTFIGLNGENIGLKIEKNILNFDNKFNLFKVL